MTTLKNKVSALHKKYPFTIPILSFFIGVGILFSYTKYCDFLYDECYMTSCILDYKNSPLAVLVFAIGHYFGEIFGLNILHLRYLAQIFYLIAIGSSVIYLQHKTRNSLLSSLVFILACFISNISGFGFYNWDTGTYPFVAFFAISLMIYIDSPSLKNLLLIGILTGLLISARITLAVCPILVICAIFYLSKKDESNQIHLCKHIALYLISTIITLISLYLMIWGSFNGILHAFGPDNIITGHSLTDIGVYVWRFKVLFPNVFLAWGLGFLTFYFAIQTFKPHTSKVLIIIFAITSILAGWSVLRTVAITHEYNTPIYGLGFSYVIIPALVFPLFIFKKSSSNSWILFKGILIVAMMLILGLGSDTAFERWHGSFLFPISIACIYPALSYNRLKTIYSWFGYSFVMLLIIICYRNVGAKSEFTQETCPVRYNGEIPLLLEEKEYLDILEPEIAKLVSENKRFTFWGRWHLFYRLNFEPEYAYSRHVYHYHFEDILKHLKHPENLDYIFVVYPKQDTSSVDVSIKSLLNAGYTIDTKTDYYILFKSPEKDATGHSAITPKETEPHTISQ